MEKANNGLHGKGREGTQFLYSWAAFGLDNR